MDLQNASFKTPSTALLSDMGISCFCVVNKPNGYPLEYTDLKVVFARMAAVEKLTDHIETVLSQHACVRLRCVSLHDSNGAFEAINFFDIFMDKDASDSELESMRQYITKEIEDSSLFSTLDAFDCKHRVECSVRREDLLGRDFHRDHARFYTRYT